MESGIEYLLPCPPGSRSIRYLRPVSFPPCRRLANISAQGVGSVAHGNQPAAVRPGRASLPEVPATTDPELVVGPTAWREQVSRAGIRRLARRALVTKRSVHRFPRAEPGVASGCRTRRRGGRRRLPAFSGGQGTTTSWTCVVSVGIDPLVPACAGRATTWAPRLRLLSTALWPLSSMMTVPGHQHYGSSWKVRGCCATGRRWVHRVSTLRLRQMRQPFWKRSRCCRWMRMSMTKAATTWAS